jgi:hypothetical protein
MDPQSDAMQTLGPECPAYKFRRWLQKECPKQTSENAWVAPTIQTKVRKQTHRTNAQCVETLCVMY